MEFILKKDGFYFIQNNKELAYITFYIENDILYVDHTFVDTSLRGKGIASKLVLEVCDYALKNNFYVVPICSYVVNWFQNNPEYMKVLKKHD